MEKLTEPQEEGVLLDENHFQKIVVQANLYNDMIQNMKKAQQDAILIHN